jgi:hypothetical protein
MRCLGNARSINLPRCPLPGERPARTLRDAGNYIRKLRETEGDTPEWRLAIQMPYQIGRPHMAFNPELQMNVLTWRPQTANSTGKVLSIPVLPFLQEALDAMPRVTALTFLTTDYGTPARISRYLR